MTRVDDTDSDWFEDIALVARHFKNGPSATYEPVRLQRPPDFIDLGSVIDLPAAIARWELAIEGRALLPTIALWIDKVMMLGNQEEPDGAGDDVLETFWVLTGQRAVEKVMLEIDWIGGDPTSKKGGPPPTRDDIDLYCADGTPEQIHSMTEWLAKNREILRIGDETAS